MSWSRPAGQLAVGVANTQLADYANIDTVVPPLID